MSDSIKIPAEANNIVYYGPNISGDTIARAANIHLQPTLHDSGKTEKPEAWKSRIGRWIASFVPTPATTVKHVGPPKIAVFVDIENIGNHEIDAVFSHLKARNWNPTCRRAYGCAISARKEILRKHGIVGIEVTPSSPGKNSADFWLVVDCMAELCAGRVDGFCVISSDADFTRLAWAIRERGLPIFIYGSRFASPHLRHGCTEFFELRAVPVAALPAPATLGASNKIVGKDRSEYFDFVAKLVQAEGKTTLDRVNRESVRRDPHFSSRRYFASKLKTLLKACSNFDLKPVMDGGEVVDYEVRLVKKKA